MGGGSGRSDRARVARLLEAMGVVGAVGLLAACGAGDAEDDADAGPTPGVPALTATARPTIFAPGVVSTEAPELGGSFLPDGSEVYFNRGTEDLSRFSIYVSAWENGAWSPARVAPFSGQYFDIDPFVTPDGERLLFASDRPLSAGDSVTDLNIWVAERHGDSWNDPYPLGSAVNSPADESFVSMAADGTLYVASNRDGVARRTFVSPRDTDGGYSTSELLDAPWNDRGGIGNPLVDPEGRVLVFPYMIEGNPLGGVDLFVSCREGGAWSEPVPLGGGVNSEFTEFAPGLAPGGETLVFTSERPGVADPVAEGRPPGDIYLVAFSSSAACSGGAQASSSTSGLGW